MFMDIKMTRLHYKDGCQSRKNIIFLNHKISCKWTVLIKIYNTSQNSLLNIVVVEAMHSATCSSREITICTITDTPVELGLMTYIRTLVLDWESNHYVHDKM